MSSEESLIENISLHAFPHFSPAGGWRQCGRMFTCSALNQIDWSSPNTFLLFRETDRTCAHAH